MRDAGARNRPGAQRPTGQQLESYTRHDASDGLVRETPYSPSARARLFVVAVYCPAGDR